MSVFQFFLLLPFLTIGFLVKSHANFTSCAGTSSTDELGKAFTLRDGSMLENLLDFELKYQNDVSWKIHPTCKLNYCTGTYMTKQCGIFQTGNVSMSSSWGSVLCSCKKKCECFKKLSDKNVCARVYMKPESCSACNAAYTEIQPGQNDAFSNKWQNKIANIVVTADCNLTVFKKEDFRGGSKLISGPFVENRTKSLASWKCICNFSPQLVHSDINTTLETSPVPNINIPDSIDDVIELLAEHNWTHSGLLASLSALSNGFSAKNVYILVLGSSGAGKSSVINTLLGQNLTTVGDYKSITSQIVEHRIPFSLSNLGIKNSELRIIDTPGLGDTGGIENDATFLATLENYLTTHSELKSRKPNFVLILHSFNDNRFNDEASNFIRMVRALDALRPLITIDQYPNLLFLFSHLCSVSSELQRNPLSLLAKFKQAVKNFTFFPNPILATVGENLGRRQNLLMRRGNTQLPNLELYPQNVLDKMDFISTRNGDKIGNAVINSEELQNRNLDYGTISKIEYPLVGSSHQSVAKYLKILQMNTFGVYSTEISILLAEAYKTMSSDLKLQFPDALEKLQKLLFQQGIFSKADIPNILTKKLDLIFKTQENLAMLYLLQNALELYPPPFPVKFLVGESYDIFKPSIIPTQIFEITTNKNPSSIGFTLPNFIKCIRLEPLENPTNIFFTFDTERQYFDHIILTYFDIAMASKANSSKLYSSVVENVKPGYFVKNIKCRYLTPDNFCFSIVRKYHTFQLELNPEFAVLQPKFLQTLNTLPEYHEHNYENVNQWTKFFREYGTHVVTSAEGGGQLEIQFNIPSFTKNVNAEVDKIIKIIDYIENPPRYALENKHVYKWVIGNASSVKYTLTFHGGDQKYYVQDFSSSNLEHMSEDFSKWRKSLKYFPVAFSKKVVPIHEFIGKFLVIKKQAELQSKIKVAFERLLSATLKYTEDPKIIAKRERQKKQEEDKRIQQQQLLIEQMKKEHEAVRLKLEEEKKKKMAEAKALEETLRQQEREQAAKEREMEQRKQREKEELEKKLKMEKCIRERNANILPCLFFPDKNLQFCNCNEN